MSASKDTKKTRRAEDNIKMADGKISLLTTLKGELGIKMNMKFPDLRLTLRLLIGIVCVACFILLSWDQLDLFWKGKTGVSQSWELHPVRKLPLIVFCAKQPYRSKVVNLPSLIRNRETYRQESNIVGAKFNGKIKLDYEFYKFNDSELKQFELATYYHGICQAFYINMDLDTFEYVSFITAAHQDLLMYLLEEGEELFLSLEYFVKPVTVITIDSSTMVNIRPTVLLRKKGRHRKCNDYDMSGYSNCLLEMCQGSCCRTMLGDRFFPSLPACPTTNDSIMVKYLNNRNGEDVNNITVKSCSDMIKRTYILDGIQGVKSGLQCFPPCNVTNYEYDRIPLLHMDEKALGGRIIYMAFTTPLTVMSEEYLIYNFGGIVAAVGGAIGLFIGVSLYDMLIRMIEFAFQKSNYITEKMERSTAVVAAVAEAPKPLGMQQLAHLPPLPVHTPTHEGAC